MFWKEFAVNHDESAIGNGEKKNDRCQMLDDKMIIVTA